MSSLYSPNELIIIASNYEKITCGIAKYARDDSYHGNFRPDVVYPQVKKAQEKLVSLGFSALLQEGWGTDGKFGSRTRSALNDFAGAYGLGQDLTYEQLMDALIDPEFDTKYHRKDKQEDKKETQPTGANDSVPNQWAETIRYTTMTIYNQLFINNNAGQITPQTVNTYLVMIQTNKGIIDPYTQQLELAIKDPKYSQEDHDKWRKIIDDAYNTINSWTEFLQTKKQPQSTLTEPPASQQAQQQTQQVQPPQFNPNEPMPSEEPNEGYYYVGGVFYSIGGGWLWVGGRWKRNHKQPPPGGTKGHRPQATRPMPQRQLARPVVQQRPNGHGGGGRHR